MRTVTIVRHRVVDFDAWKVVYDSFGAVQRAGGVREHAVLRSSDDPGMVVVVHTFDDPATARAFFQQPELGEAMAKAGVDLATVQTEHLDEVVAGRL